jgi:antibiotic biosynthesis monooxygenase (ABM) superfamily enzyme
MSMTLLRIPRRARLLRVLFGLIAISVAAALAALPAQARFTQQDKLIGSGAVGTARQGWSVALSADGNTAIVGGRFDNDFAGAAWVFVRAGGVWIQQGDKLVGEGAVGPAQQGLSVALSADGNTAIVGGPFDNTRAGATWIFTRSGGVWMQQAKLVGSGAVPTSVLGVRQGLSVALSADGNTALVGGPFDNGFAGAGWVFVRSGGVWTQQGEKLVGTGAVGFASQGQSVSLSADGNTALVGGPDAGAAWVYTRSGGVWTQQGEKLVGTGAAGSAAQGSSVALSADGNTAIVGGRLDNGTAGATWIFTRSGGVWTQQGGKLVGTGAAGDAQQGFSVALSADGNTAIVGGPGNLQLSGAGATWVFTRSGGVWTQQGQKLVGSGGSLFAEQGTSVALSADGDTAIVGGSGDNGEAGAAWVFGRPGITSMSPNAGTVNGGTGVTIVGQNFFNVTGVTFGDVPATNVTAVNPNTVLATTPPHAAGRVSVFLNTRTGGDRALLAYTYQRQPTAVKLTSTPNPSNVGERVIFTAQVTAGSGGAASGSVIFTNDTQPLATVNLRHGLARLSLTDLAVGGHRIRARFVPNGMFEGSSSHLRQLVRN